MSLMPRGGRGRGRLLRLLPDPGPLCVLVARLIVAVVVVVVLQLVKVDVVEAVLAVVTVPMATAVMRVQLLHEQHLGAIFFMVRKR